MTDDEIEDAILALSKKFADANLSANVVATAFMSFLAALVITNPEVHGANSRDIFVRFAGEIFDETLLVFAQTEKGKVKC